MAINALLTDDTTVITSKMMELTTERQRIVANNKANANTPGYIRLELNFQKKLTDIVKSGDMNELNGFSGKAVADAKDAVNSEGNNVVIPKEMNEMAQNSVFYNLLTKAFTTKLSILKAAIRTP